ncbi:MAG: hypothetical protein JXN62_13550, partial [Bacteroidales bacterium]|nr:hypothetical protein [Bacteroidales bacterium]
DKNDFPEESMVALLGLYREALVKIIDHCGDILKNEKEEFTPSDFTYKNLEMDEMDEMLGSLLDKINK